MRRSLLPGMRYPRKAPESNHLLTVRGATLQILATSPVVRTSLTLVALIVHLSPCERSARTVDTLNIDWPDACFRSSAPLLPNRAGILRLPDLSDAMLKYKSPRTAVRG